MQINGNTEATLRRRFNIGERPGALGLGLAIGKLRETGEMLLAYPAAQRRWMFVDTPAGELDVDDVLRLRGRGWQ